MAEYVGMTPTVIVGLGGTGKEILIKIRRMIVESYGSLDSLPIVSFVHIDTEQNAKVSEPQTVLKQDISLKPVEQVWAKVENAKALLNSISSYPYLEEWFPSELRGTDSILAGAGQIRALGRFAFSLNYPAIKSAFENAKNRIIGHEKFMLDQGVQLDKGINCFIVCSLSGGTGSGMVLDLAYNLRDWLPASLLPQTSAYLVLPGAFSGLGDRVIANAYAALMELNHYSKANTRFECQYSSSASERITSQSGQDVPFNFCYLVGNSNEKVTLPTLGATLEMVAQNIFLDFSSGFSQYKKLVRDNIRKHWASPDAMGYPQNFISFGLASVQFPVRRVSQACSSRLAARVVAHWENADRVPGAMRDVIQTEILPNLQLAESDNQHQMLDSISVGNNLKPLSKEVASWVSSIRKRRNDLDIPPENLRRFITVEEEKFSPHFHDTDPDPRRWSDYFQKMWDNLTYLKTQKTTELSQLVKDMVADRTKGPRFTRVFLETLLTVLSDYRTRFDQDRQKVWLTRERTASNNLQTLLSQLEEHAGKFMLINRKAVLDKDFNGIMVALGSLYTAKVEIKSRALGVELIDTLKEEASRLLTQLGKLDKVLEQLRQKLLDREETYLKETGTLTVNGILLYNAKDVDTIFEQIVSTKEESLYQTLGETCLEEVNAELFDLATFDTLRVQDLFERLLNACVGEFLDKTHLQASVARKFLEEYPTLEQQEAQIKITFEKSEPFLRFSQEQVNLSWDNRAEKRQSLVGIHGGNHPTDAAVAALLPMIRKSSTLTDKDIRPLNDLNHIFFIQETGAFPLRLIEGLAKMRTIYRSVSQSDKNPLHTHQDYRQFRDIMPLGQEETQARNNFLLAKAFGILVEVENQVTQFTEVRLNYTDPKTGLEKVAAIGTSWDQAEESLMADANRKIRDLLADMLRHIGDSATTKPQKQDLYQKLLNCLQDIEQSLVGGKDNPAYGKAEAAIESYVKTHNLMVAPVQPVVPPIMPSPSGTGAPSPAPAAPQPAASSASAENIDRFRKLVATCYKNGEPSASEKALLDRFQQKYGIDQATADALIAEVAPTGPSPDSVEEYALMYRVFLENDGEIDLEEQAQLLELQDELNLNNDQILAIETQIKAELNFS